MRERKYNTKPNSTSFKKGHKGLVGNKNPLWKGNEVGYGALHDWVNLHLGKPKYCEDCKRTDKKKYEWANISKKYLREPNDWKRLCTSCHHKFDNSRHKMWKTRRICQEK